MIVSDSRLRFFVAPSDGYFLGAGAYVLTPVGGVHVLSRHVGISQVFQSGEQLLRFGYYEVPNCRTVLAELSKRPGGHWRECYNVVLGCNDQVQQNLLRGGSHDSRG